METVTREQIRQKLREWQSGSITAEGIQSWAGSRWMSEHFTYEDWEFDEFSASNEVLAALDMLDMNLTTEADAEAFIEFLDTPLGEYPIGYNRMKKKIRSADFEARRRSLRGIPPYAAFLK
jgi:hypothetical protein